MLLAPEGAATWFAEQLGISQPAVTQWYEIPIKRVPAISALTKIPQRQLRADGRVPPPLVERQIKRMARLVRERRI
jgi:DNA-binding transcriptional regulator YdaS (Cro superfamily)